MEDDAGKSIHSETENLSYVDLNRTGVPLIEIVSGPDIHSPDQAVSYLKALRNILVYLDICDGNMQEGNFRCDANISVRPKGKDAFGTRTELKNMNSFRHVHKALEFEIERQTDLLIDGEEVVQETRLFEEETGRTRGMRGKEEAHDYRYFPDPDLVPLRIEDQWLQKWTDELPELPIAKMERFVSEYRIPEYDAQVLTSERELADYFEQTLEHYYNPKMVSNWMMSEMLRELHEGDVGVRQAPFSPKQFAGLLKLIDEDKISTKLGKQIFPELFQKGLEPENYVQQKGLVQISDQGELDRLVKEVLEENPDEVQAYKGGKKKLLSFFMGQVMKKSKGQANPKLVNEMLQRKLQ